MHKRSYDDFDAFAASIRDVDAAMMLNNPVHRSWSIEQANIGDLDFQYGRLGSGNILEGQSWPTGWAFYLPLTPSTPYLANGRTMGHNHILILEPGCEFQLSTVAPHDWCSIFVPQHILGPLDQTQTGLVAGSDLRKSRCRIIQANALTTARFYLIVRHILAASASATRFTTTPGAITAKDEVLSFVRLLLGYSEVSQRSKLGRRKVARDEILSRCRLVMERKDNQLIRLGDLTAAAGVSERTLRIIFNERFGVGPVRYFQLRRLHKLRRRLQSADPDKSSVTDLMTECGIWEFGLWSRRYRHLFGESPSQTLKSLSSLAR